MFLDLTGDQRGRPDSGEMVFASTAPASSTAAATTSRRDFLMGVDLRLIGVIVDVVVALKCVERDGGEEESVYFLKEIQMENIHYKK